MAVEFNCRYKRRTSEITFIWVIENFISWCDSRLEIKSPIFGDRGAHHTEWQLHLYPKGLDGVAPYMRLELRQVNEGRGDTDVKASYQMISFDEKAHRFPFLRDSVTKVLASNPTHFQVSSMKQSQMLYYPDGNLKIQCITEIGDFLSALDIKGERAAKEQKTQPLDGLEQYMGSDYLSDVEFIVAESTFPAHKIILAAASRVFTAMFQKDRKENQTNQVDVVDVEPQVFQEMLRYIYTGKVDNSDTMAPELMAAAEKYQLEQLKNICEGTLADGLSVDNAVDLLIMADTYSAAMLKNKTLDLITSHKAEVRQTVKWKKLLKSHPTLVAEVYDRFME